MSNYFFRLFLAPNFGFIVFLSSLSVFAIDACPDNYTGYSTSMGGVERYFCRNSEGHEYQIGFGNAPERNPSDSPSSNCESINTGSHGVKK
jgi:hypothetical protein